MKITCESWTPFQEKFKRTNISIIFDITVVFSKYGKTITNSGMGQ